MNFVDLPRSIRHQIYSYALDTELVNVGSDPVSYTHSLDNTSDGLIQFQASRSPFPVQTALFRVNKAISKEALDYFYSKNLFIRLQVFSENARHAKNMLTESGLLFSTASVDSLDRCTAHALNLVLMEEKSGTRRVVTMFPAQYLPRLVSFLLRASEASKSWASTQSLITGVENGYEFSKAKLQGDLLEPLRGLAGLESAAIEEKNILPRYAAQLQAELTGPEPTADAWLKAATEAADAADTARDAKDYDTALEYAQAAIITMTSGYLTRAEMLHSQDEAFAKGMQRLRWRTELGIGVTLSLKHAAMTSSRGWLKQKTDASIQISKDLLLAESSVSKALSLATDSPSPKSNPWFLSVPVEVIPPNKRVWFTDFERAQSWYALGVVHLSLGEHLFGAGDLERALEIWGNEANKDNVEKAFARARAGIDADAEDMWSGAIRPGSGLDQAARLASIEA